MELSDVQMELGSGSIEGIQGIDFECSWVSCLMCDRRWWCEGFEVFGSIISAC